MSSPTSSRASLRRTSAAKNGERPTSTFSESTSLLSENDAGAAKMWNKSHVPTRNYGSLESGSGAVSSTTASGSSDQSSSNESEWDVKPGGLDHLQDRSWSPARSGEDPGLELQQSQSADNVEPEFVFFDYSAEKPGYRVCSWGVYHYTAWKIFGGIFVVSFCLGALRCTLLLMRGEESSAFLEWFWIIDNALLILYLSRCVYNVSMRVWAPTIEEMTPQSLLPTTKTTPRGASSTGHNQHELSSIYRSSPAQLQHADEEDDGRSHETTDPEQHVDCSTINLDDDTELSSKKRAQRAMARSASSGPAFYALTDQESNPMEDSARDFFSTSQSSVTPSSMKSREKNTAGTASSGPIFYAITSDQEEEHSRSSPSSSDSDRDYFPATLNAMVDRQTQCKDTASDRWWLHEKITSFFTGNRADVDDRCQNTDESCEERSGCCSEEEGEDRMEPSEVIHCITILHYKEPFEMLDRLLQQIGRWKCAGEKVVLIAMEDASSDKEEKMKALAKNARQSNCEERGAKNNTATPSPHRLSGSGAFSSIVMDLEAGKAATGPKKSDDAENQGSPKEHIVDVDEPLIGNEASAPKQQSGPIPRGGIDKLLWCTHTLQPETEVAGAHSNHFYAQLCMEKYFRARGQLSRVIMTKLDTNMEIASVSVSQGGEEDRMLEEVEAIWCYKCQNAEERKGACFLPYFVWIGEAAIPSQSCVAGTSTSTGLMSVQEPLGELRRRGIVERVLSGMSNMNSGKDIGNTVVCGSLEGACEAGYCPPTMWSDDNNCNTLRLAALPEGKRYHLRTALLAKLWFPSAPTAEFSQWDFLRVVCIPKFKRWFVAEAEYDTFLLAYMFNFLDPETVPPVRRRGSLLWLGFWLLTVSYMARIVSPFLLAYGVMNLVPSCAQHFAQRADATLAKGAAAADLYHYGGVSVFLSWAFPLSLLLLSVGIQLFMQSKVRRRFQKPEPPELPSAGGGFSYYLARFSQWWESSDVVLLLGITVIGPFLGIYALWTVCEAALKNENIVHKVTADIISDEKKENSASEQKDTMKHTS
ncbi:unnamed protein product [Amoebophrya sp. A25]|nr:unnamed protein product [Amoebophrya sp. A25]|eukprot:GSA25T00009912001.1